VGSGGEDLVTQRHLAQVRQAPHLPSDRAPRDRRGARARSIDRADRHGRTYGEQLTLDDIEDDGLTWDEWFATLPKIPPDMVDRSKRATRRRRD
jgi:hypothetical protein